MRVAFYLASKLLRSKRNKQLLSLISVITILGIALGVAVLIISLTVLNGFDSAVREKIVNFNSHLIITGFSDRNLPEIDYLKDNITFKSAESIESISSFISKNSIIRASNTSEGIVLFGIDFDQNNLGLDRYIIKGNFESENSGRPGIILGKKLAMRLGVGLNDVVTLLSPAGDSRPSIYNPPVIKQFAVSGIYESGMAGYDDQKAYIDIKIAQGMFLLGNKVSGYNIRLKDIDKIDSIERNLQESLGFPFYVRSIFKEHQNIFTWLELQKEPIPIILGMIILVSVFNIIGTILMTVIERTPAIGILKSLGSTRKLISNIFLIQGIYLGSIGIAAGNILAFILSLVQIKFNIISLPESVYFLSAVPIELNAVNYIIVSIITFLLCIVSSLIPSYIASKIQPISAIRFD